MGKPCRGVFFSGLNGTQWRYRYPSTTVVSYATDSGGIPGTSMAIDLNTTLTGVGSGQFCRVTLLF
jgi:hypothetical protein